MMKSILLGTTIAAVLAATPNAFGATQDDQSTAEIQHDLKALRGQVEELQKRLDAQSASQKHLELETQAAAAQAVAATAATTSIPAQVQAAVAADKPKTDQLHYKGVDITLGGFAAVESVYRQHDTNNDVNSGYNSIPFASNSVAQTNQFLFSARQTRLSALVEGNISADTHLASYTEVDFLGAAQTANSKESDSYNPRLRQAYGTVDWDSTGWHMLAGQALSLAVLNSNGITLRNEVVPPTIDAQWMPGMVWTRQPQLRFTKDFAKQLWLAISFENPQSTFYAGPNALPKTVEQAYQTPGTGAGFNSANQSSLNRLPDVITKVAYEVPLPDRKLHIEGYHLYRDFYERLDYSNKNTSGSGWGGGITVPIIPKKIDFEVIGLAGRGIGRYGSGQLSDVTFNPQGDIEPIHEIIGLAGFTVHVTPMLDWYLYAGEEKESTQSYDLVSSTGTVTAYGLGNSLYSNAGCFSETSTAACVGNEARVEQATSGVWWKPYVGSFGTLRWGVQYSHTEYETFAGKGGAPIVIQNMVFLSFRYYPF
jgi:hypothetical protein